MDHIFYKIRMVQKDPRMPSPKREVAVLGQPHPYAVN
jgi:hypothetical protein